MRYNIDLESEEPMDLDVLVRNTMTLATVRQRVKEIMGAGRQQKNISALVEDYGRAASKQAVSPPISSLMQPPVAPPALDTKTIMNNAIEEITHGVKDMMLSTVTAVTSNIQNNMIQLPSAAPYQHRSYQPPPHQHSSHPPDAMAGPSSSQTQDVPASLIPPQAQPNQAMNNYGTTNNSRCNYCWSTEHNRRWQCPDYRTDISNNRIHLNFEGRIWLVHRIQEHDRYK